MSHADFLDLLIFQQLQVSNSSMSCQYYLKRQKTEANLGDFQPLVQVDGTVDPMESMVYSNLVAGKGTRTFGEEADVFGQSE